MAQQRIDYPGLAVRHVPDDAPWRPVLPSVAPTSASAGALLPRRHRHHTFVILVFTLVSRRLFTLPLPPGFLPSSATPHLLLFRPSFLPEDVIPKNDAREDQGPPFRCGEC